MVDRRGTARGRSGAPGIDRGTQGEVAGLPREKVEELFLDTITQVKAGLAGIPRK